MNDLLEKVKTAMRIVTDDYDAEISDLISACLLDLGIAGVTNNDNTNKLIVRAVITYCRFSFGTPSDYDKLKASYDEQKAQMSHATGYTTWQMM